jgi:hypothetical protein
MPLARWLSDGEQTIRKTLKFASIPGTHLSSRETDDDDILARLLAAEEMGRADGISIAESRTAAALEEQRCAALASEIERDAMWSARLIAVSESSLSGLMAELQSSIELKLNDVLMPFLSDQVVARSRAELLQLIAQELSAKGNEMLEFHAPSSLHDDLQLMLERLGLRVTLIESERIEMLCRSGCSRFEALASQWLALVCRGES